MLPSPHCSPLQARFLNNICVSTPLLLQRHASRSCSSSAASVVAAVAAVPVQQQAAAASQPATAVAPVQLDPEVKARHKRPAGWVPPGPPPAAAVVAAATADTQGAAAGAAAAAIDPDLRPAPHETLSFLTGDWRIFQLRDGHRWSMDDMMTAYVALQTVQQQQHHHQQQQQQQLTPPAAPGVPSGLSRLHHVLDLGCGIGSVLLMVAWGLRRMHLEQQQQQQQQRQQQQRQQQQQEVVGGSNSFAVVSVGVEAQAVSYQLALRSIQYNLGEQALRGGLLQVCNQDLRQPLPPHLPQSYQLITGTPPYIPQGSGGQSNRPQKGPCCVEIRGGIEDYCQAAAAVLAPGGHFVVCCGLQGQPFKGQRAQRAAAAAGLVIMRQVTVITKDGKPPLFAVYVMQTMADVLNQAEHWQRQQQQRRQQEEEGTGADGEGCREAADVLKAQFESGLLTGVEEAFVVRDAAGCHTAAWHAAREAMGLPPLAE